MTFKGVNFRQSATHPSATDSADDTYWHAAGNESAYTAVRGAFTNGFGRDSALATPLGVDRSGTGIDARLAGIVYDSGSTTLGFAFKLPSGAGQYRVRVAMGDRLAARSGMTLAITDGSSGAATLHSATLTTTSADWFADTNGTQHSAADWPANNTTATVTFSTDVGYLLFGSGYFLNHIAFEPVAASSDLSGNVTLSDVAPSGTLADAGPTSLSGNVTLDAIAPSGTLGLEPGTVTVPALRNWSGSLQTSVTIPVVTVLSLSTGAQVLALTDQTTDGTTANLAITSTSLVVGTTYMVAGWNADGSQRFAVPLTAA